MDTKKGFLWAIAVWSFGAILHAFCGIATSGIVAGEWFVGFEGAKEAIKKVHDFSRVINVSVVLFIFARFVLAIGEAGNFPAAIKTTAEYFPKKDRAFATSIFNAGSTIGALGFVWMGYWIFMYDKPESHPKVNQAEFEYFQQDDVIEAQQHDVTIPLTQGKVSILNCLKHNQTWAFAVGKFMTDGVWWLYLFWMPAYLSSVYGVKSSDLNGQLALFVLYSITMLSLIGGWLPSYFINKGMNAYAGRMRAMLIFAF